MSSLRTGGAARRRDYSDEEEAGATRPLSGPAAALRLAHDAGWARGKEEYENQMAPSSDLAAELEATLANDLKSLGAALRPETVAPQAPTETEEAQFIAPTIPSAPVQHDAPREAPPDDFYALLGEPAKPPIAEMAAEDDVLPAAMDLDAAAERPDDDLPPLAGWMMGEDAEGDAPIAEPRALPRIWLALGLVALVAVIGGTALALNVAIFRERAPALDDSASKAAPAASGDWRGALQAVPAKQSYDRLDESADVAPAPSPAPAAPADAGTVGASPPVTEPAAEAPAPPVAETPSVPSLLSPPDSATPATALSTDPGAASTSTFDLRGPASPAAAPASEAPAPAKPAPVKSAPAKPSAATSGAPMPITPSASAAGPSARLSIPPGPAVITSAVKIRGGPDNGASVVGSFAAGDTVTVLRCDFWCEVSAGTKHGYVYQRFITPSVGVAKP